jgi:hypothetical protein
MLDDYRLLEEKLGGEGAAEKTAARIVANLRRS